MTEDDEMTPDGLDPADELYTLLIAVAPSPAERIRLAERLDGIAPLLLVADLGELRRLIPARTRPPPRPRWAATAPWCWTRSGRGPAARAAKSS
ncbi:hypothetical protein ACFQY4_24650 [Catellatospora bangladeshensis]|uniref:hypothetical protein n=1 Tax=Catellatospora bangladeshensis TaxID=310355 RepID=UPI0036063D65